MKKLILSALFVSAFSMGLFAKGSVEVPAVSALEVSVTLETTQLVEEEDECITTYIPICSDGVAIDWIVVRICAPNPYDLADSMGC